MIFISFSKVIKGRNKTKRKENCLLKRQYRAKPSDLGEHGKVVCHLSSSALVSSGRTLKCRRALSPAGFTVRRRWQEPGERLGILRSGGELSRKAETMIHPTLLSFAHRLQIYFFSTSSTSSPSLKERTQGPFIAGNRWCRRNRTPLSDNLRTGALKHSLFPPHKRFLPCHRAKGCSSLSLSPFFILPRRRVVQ